MCMRIGSIAVVCATITPWPACAHLEEVDVVKREQLFNAGRHLLSHSSLLAL